MKHWAILLSLPFIAACSMFSSSADPSDLAAAPVETAPPAATTTLPLDAAQRRWWEENRHLARHVPGQGWQVPGHAGFYTEQGARIVPAHMQVSADEIARARSTNQISAPERLLENSRSLVGQGRDEAVARKLLTEGHALYAQRKFAEAEEKFLEASERWPDSPLAEDALFLTAECQFFSDRYPDARRQYEGLLMKYTNSRYLDPAIQRLFSIAQYWDQIHKEDPHHFYSPNLTDDTRPFTNASSSATEVYRRIYLNHPTGQLADDAIMAIAGASFRSGRWEDADYHYTLLRNEYPTSKHQFEAHLLGLQTKFNKYQGPYYDRKSLEEARRLGERLLKQFPQELAGRNERERIEKMVAEVEAQGALREWQMARYYQKNGHNRAAKLYYGNVLNDYPQSEFAQRAREEIIALGGEPETPPPRFVWFTDLFDGTTRQ